MTLIERKNFDRRRISTGSIDGSTGRYNDGGQTVTTFSDGSFQRNSDDAENLPEGERSRYEQTLYTDADVRGPDQYDDQPADEIRYPAGTGPWYEVRSVQGDAFLLPGKKFILLRKQES